MELERPELKKKKSPIFIGLHFGVGKYSKKKSNAYKKLARASCAKALEILKQGGTAGDAVVAATILLEDSGILNAGKGSNLTSAGTVECDAGYMDSEGCFGGVGALPGVPNPILVAKKLAMLQMTSPLLSHGRIPPNFLVGSGAKEWAKNVNIPTCEDADMVSLRSKKRYDRYKKEIKVDDNVQDTVGAVALDMFGSTAATSSSGGNSLKFPGRVGMVRGLVSLIVHSIFDTAPMYGCGCWASTLRKKYDDRDNSPLQEDVDPFSVALSTSGPGEFLTKLQFPKCCAERLAEDPCAPVLPTIVNHCKNIFDISEDTLLKRHIEPKLFGCICLTWSGNSGEFSWIHSSDFIIAYGGSCFRQIKVKLNEEDSKSLQDIGPNSLKASSVILKS